MKKMISIVRAFAAAFAIAPLALGSAQAAVLYGTYGNGGASTSTLVKIDTTTGSVTTIGNVGYVLNGLTWDASTSTLFGSARNDVGLVKINLSTGAGSLVARGFNSRANGCTGGQNVLLAANAGGSLFGWCDPSVDDLMSIDKTTGIARVVGNSGLSTGGHGLAFDNNNNLYVYNGGQAYLMNTATGQATSVRYLGYAGHHGDFNPENNYYYGIDGTGINILDLVGNAGYVGRLNVNGLHTLAFVSESNALPEPGSVTLLGLGVAGLLAARRRQRARA